MRVWDMMRQLNNRKLRLPKRVGSRGQRDKKEKKISFCYLLIVLFLHAFTIKRQPSCNKQAVSFHYMLSLFYMLSNTSFVSHASVCATCIYIHTRRCVFTVNDYILSVLFSILEAVICCSCQIPYQFLCCLSYILPQYSLWWYPQY